MKALTNLFNSDQISSNELSVLEPLVNGQKHVEKPFRPNLDVEDILTKDALVEMDYYTIPDLSKVCLDLYQTFFEKESTNTATNFIPVLKEMENISPTALDIFELNQQTNHVLVENGLLKVVLIHWTPGQVSNIHGHAAGGCVFKVLKGSVEELRYTSDESPQLLASSTFHKGGMAYIDDRMGFHAVSNPFNSSAVTLHVYTPGYK